MAEKIQKTLEIRAEYSQALDGIAKYRVELGRSKAEAKAMTDTLKQLDKQLKDGSITEQEHAKAVLEVQKQLAANKQEQQQYADAIRTTERVVKNQITQQNEAQDSIKAMRAQLANLTKEFDEMGKAAREGAEGIKKMDAINDLTDKIKKAEEATQRYQRNVGNYKSALEGMEQATNGAKNSVLGFISGGNPLVQMLANTAQQLGSVKAAFALAAQGAAMLGKQLLVLMANPIVAFLALITSAFFALKNGIESSEERMNRFKVIMAPLQGLFDATSKALGTLCGWMLDLMEATSGAIMWLSKMAESLPLIGEKMAEGNKATQEYIEIEKLRQDIILRTRESNEKAAKREGEISDLRAKFAEKDKYTHKQRLEFLDQAIAKEREQAEENKKLAQMRLEALEREAAMADNDAAMNEKLSQARIAVDKATTELSNKLRKMNAQRVEAINAINAETAAEKRAAEEKAKARREMLEKQKETEESLWQQYEDELLALIKDGYEKQKQVTATQYQREIEELQERLDTEKDLTESSKEAIRNIIIAKRQQMNDEIKAIEKAETDEQIQKDAEEIQRKADLERMTLEARLAVAMEGSQEFYDLRQQELDMEYQQEQERIANLVATEEQKNELLRLAEQKYTEDSKALKKEQADYAQEMAKAEAAAKQTAYNQMTSAIDAMGEHSEAFAKMSKIIALGEIAVNTGKAIAGGVASAMAVPFPANLVAIATTVATVLANIATAISTVKSAKFAKGGLVEVDERHKYAGGGSVIGAGSGTSDSIRAMLSNGESVMTAAATSMYAPILSAMNQSAGGNPIAGRGTEQGEDVLTRAMLRALLHMPNPIVSVEDINTTSRRVQVMERLSRV